MTMRDICYHASRFRAIVCFGKIIAKGPPGDIAAAAKVQEGDTYDQAHSG